MKPLLRLLQTVVLWLPVCGQEEEAPINFGLPGEDAVMTNEEVVSGALLLYGRFQVNLIGDLGIVSRAAVSKVCGEAPVQSTIFQDIMTFGMSRIGFLIYFDLLPGDGGALGCLETLMQVGFGPEEPPFDVQPAPPFRNLLKWELELYEETKWLNTDSWLIQLVNLTCGSRDVFRPPVVATQVTTRTGTTTPWVFTTTSYGGCSAEDAENWVPKAPAFDAGAVDCSYAGSACICAATPGCSWSGVRCAAGSSPVSCEDCPLQSTCDPLPSAVCAAQISPCTCIFATAACQWDVDARSCSERLGAYTPLPCRVCARQDFCSPLEIDEIEPAPLSLMGRPDIGWRINITFTRDVQLAGGFAGNMQFECIDPHGKGALSLYDVTVNQVVAAGNRLTIDTQKTPNSYMRDCHLLIDDKALTDRDYNPFPGLVRGGYIVTVDDLVPPSLVGFEPPNSAVNVPLDVVVRVNFNEAVFRGTTTAGALLTALGGNNPDGTVEADVIVAEVPQDSPALEFTGSSLALMLERLDSVTLESDKQYSLSLPAGFVTDKVGNEFGTLSEGVYVFRTKQDHTVDSSSVLVSTVDVGGFGPLPTVAVIGIAVAACLLLCSSILIAAIICKVYSLRHKMRTSMVAYPEKDSIEDPDVETQASHLTEVFSTSTAIDVVHRDSVMTPPMGSPKTSVIAKERVSCMSSDALAWKVVLSQNSASPRPSLAAARGRSFSPPAVATRSFDSPTTGASPRLHRPSVNSEPSVLRPASGALATPDNTSTSGSTPRSRSKNSAQPAPRGRPSVNSLDSLSAGERSGSLQAGERSGRTSQGSVLGGDQMWMKRDRGSSVSQGTGSSLAERRGGNFEKLNMQRLSVSGPGSPKLTASPKLSLGSPKIRGETSPKERGGASSPFSGTADSPKLAPSSPLRSAAFYNDAPNNLRGPLF